MGDWSEARVKLLLKLRQDGLSFTRIRAILGIGRGAVAGKLDRLNNPGRSWATYIAERSLWTENRLSERWADRKRA